MLTLGDLFDLTVRLYAKPSEKRKIKDLEKNVNKIVLPSE